MAELELIHNFFLDNVLLALALGALVGMERERVPANKYAGVRTLALFCAGGPLSVLVAASAGSVLPVILYLVLGAVFSLLVIYIRVWHNQEELGLTTSSTVFLMGLVGVLIGYEHHFEAVSITLIAVLLLTEKEFFTEYLEMLDAKELSDAVKLGILSFVLYPVLPEGAVDPYGVLHLRKALLFVIFILLIQFAAYVSLRWLRTRMSFLLSAALGGVVSSLAVVTTMAQFVSEGKLEDSAYLAAIVAVIAMVVRNGVIAVLLAPVLLTELWLPVLSAVLVGTVFAVFYLQQTAGKDAEGIDFGAASPFSFTAAFKFGGYFLAILMISEAAQAQFPGIGVYGAAFLGGFGSSTAVVASAVTLMASTAPSITAYQAAVMVVLGAVASLLSKLVYVNLGGTTAFAKRLLVPYLFMCAALLSILL